MKPSHTKIKNKKLKSSWKLSRGTDQGDIEVVRALTAGNRTKLTADCIWQVITTPELIKIGDAMQRNVAQNKWHLRPATLNDVLGILYCMSPHTYACQTPLEFVLANEFFQP